jgi:hypothetical protein
MQGKVPAKTSKLVKGLEIVFKSFTRLKKHDSLHPYASASAKRGAASKTRIPAPPVHYEVPKFAPFVKISLQSARRVPAGD